MIAEEHHNQHVHDHEHEHKHEEVKEPDTVVQLAQEMKEPTIEQMEREPVKKCCTVSQQVKCACHCCLRTWSCSLNACEGCCTVTSATCIFMSTLALACNKCLEYIDCDGH